MSNQARYYVMYDHSTYQVNVRPTSEVTNLVTWVVSSHSDLAEAAAAAMAITIGSIDLYSIPGPWHTVSNYYKETLDEEEII